jgi:hypothetical protein
MFTIKDAIRYEVGPSAASSLPDGDSWQRCDYCLYCGRYKTAAVNHRIGWYECHHASCRKRLSAASVYAVRRFGPQIGQAARNVIGKYGKWITQSEAERYATDRVMVYCGPPVPGDADSGMHDEWEASVGGNPEQLDRYVLQALNCDLLNWARGRVREARRTSAPDIAAWEWNSVNNEKATAQRALASADRELPDYGFSAADYPYLYAREVEGLTVMQLAEREGVSPRTVKRQTRAERERFDALMSRAA